MLRSIKTLFYATALIALVAPASAGGLTSIGGYWYNIDKNTGGIVKILINIAPSPDLWIHEYGRCGNSLCDSGIELAHTYAPTVNSNIFREMTAAIVVYKRSYETETAFLIEDGVYLKVYTFTHFIDKSGRTDFWMGETFKR